MQVSFMFIRYDNNVCRPGNIAGCFAKRDNDEAWRRPPTLKIPFSSMNG